MQQKASQLKAVCEVLMQMSHKPVVQLLKGVGHTDSESFWLPANQPVNPELGVKSSP